jgi:hypothetical protein
LNLEYGEFGTAGTRGMLEIRTQIKVEGKDCVVLVNLHENKMKMVTDGEVS